MADARRKRWTLVACVLGSAVVFVDSTVVNVALPALRRDFGAGLGAQQWVMEAYLLTLGALILTGGALGDLYGRRRVFNLGLAAFGVTSVACAAAPSVEVLIGARGLQGLAGALLVPSSLAIVTATFEDDRERGAAIGSWTAWTGISIVAGPLLGGFLIEAVSWRLVFAINVPLVAATLAIVMLAMEESRDPVRRGIDAPGAALVTLGLGGIVLALTEEPRLGLDHPLVWAPLAAGAACLAGFVAHERRAASPMLPLGLFRSRNFTAANLATLAVYAGLLGSTFLISIFVQQVGGYGPLEAGLALTPVTLVLFALSRRFGAISQAVGPRALMTAGPLVAAAGLALLLRLDAEIDYWGDLLPGLLVLGLGLAMTVAPLTATVLGAVDRRRAGIASGVNNAAARVAGLIAIAVLGAAVSGRFATAIDDRLAGVPLDPAAREVVTEAKSRALEGAAREDPGRSDTATPEARARARLAPAIEDASVAGFRAAIALAALLVAAGGAISAAGIERRRRSHVRVG